MTTLPVVIEPGFDTSDELLDSVTLAANRGDISAFLPTLRATARLIDLNQDDVGTQVLTCIFTSSRLNTAAQCNVFNVMTQYNGFQYHAGTHASIVKPDDLLQQFSALADRLHTSFLEGSPTELRKQLDEFYQIKCALLTMGQRDPVLAIEGTLFNAVLLSDSANPNHPVYANFKRNLKLIDELYLRDSPTSNETFSTVLEGIVLRYSTQLQPLAQAFLEKAIEEVGADTPFTELSNEARGLLDLFNYQATCLEQIAIQFREILDSVSIFRTIDQEKANLYGPFLDREIWPKLEPDFEKFKAAPDLTVRGAFYTRPETEEDDHPAAAARGSL